MFRLSQYLHALNDNEARNKPPGPQRKPSGPVVIWNLVRRCNLTCKHCYSTSADIDFPGELSTAEAVVVADTSGLAKGTPALCYGLRGLAALEITLTGPARDLHSGTYGGTLANPATAIALVAVIGGTYFGKHLLSMISKERFVFWFQLVLAILAPSPG